MKRILLFFGILAIATLFSSAAMAENRGGAVVITPVIGGYHSDGTLGIDPNILYGLKLGYNFTDRLGIEAHAHYLHTKEYFGSYAGKMEQVNYRVELLYHLFPKDSFVPFLAVGGGGLSSSYDRTNTDDTSGVVSYGAGVKYALADDLALRADARMLSVFWNPSVVYNYEYTLGLAFQFGGESKAARAAEAPPVAKAVEAAPAPVAKPAPAPEPAPVPKPAPAPVVAPAPAPSASIAATPQSILPGGSSTLSWKSQNSTSCSIQPGIGSVQPNGSMIVSPSASTSYSLTCVGLGGSASSATTLAIAKPVLKPVAAPPDADKDGVPDALDKCPNTPYGIKVDNDGCPPPEPTACNSFTLEIEFDTGKADVKPRFDQEIKKIADFLTENPGSTASIEGHTDNVGSANSNLKLSQKRADAVRNYLIKKFGVAADRLSAKGFGLTKPRATNKTAQGRHENRRVEALLYCGDTTVKATDHDTHK
jgi:OOP family OmpA-OmpF porin